MMASKTVRFLAIFFMGLSLIPFGAHLFALPNKIGMEREAYFTAQQIYAGWQFVGIIWIAALILTLALAIGLRGQRPAFYFAVIGFVSLVAALIVFFMWTFPGNQATVNWTTAPENWDALRTSWEYSHAVNAIIVLVGFCAITLASLTAEDTCP